LETLEATRPIFSGLAIDVQAIPFADHSFGAVIGLGLLDNVRNRSRCLDEIQQVLKPGGKFYASAGGRSHLQEIEELVRQFLPDADFGGSPERFGLENGEDLLSPWFSEIRLFRYEDELEFDTPEPLIAYALSEAYVEANLGGEEERLFRRHVEQVISRQGKVRVKSEKGLFEAIRYI
jgi:SAM-dependent methyltransferase